MSDKTAGKDVIYIDVDDEITTIIDKLQASPQKIVALVLPKRASAFQSIVNMKLLKRSADHAKKNVVLITGDPNVTPLAGGVGLHVAKSLQSKPEVPDAPELDDKADIVEEEADEPAIDKRKSLAELNGDEEETIELDDDEPNTDDTESAKKTGKSPFKKFKIPNFNRFRKLLFLGGAGLILLIVGSVMAFMVLPKAKVIVSTDSTVIEISQDVHLKVGEAVTLDTAQAIVPAHKQELKKTLSQEVPATGQQNNGEKATGKIDMTAKNCSSLSTPAAVPAGTGVTSSGKTFITQEKATFGGGTFDGTCLNFKASNIKVTAQAGGAGSNIDSGSFTVAGRSDVAATGTTSGGTDLIEKVISQADIDGAKQKIGTQDLESARMEVIQALKDGGYRPIESSFATTTPTTKQSANAGDKAETVTVTQEVVYTMLGAKDEDFEKLAAEQAKAKIDPSKQSIIDYGLESAIFTQLSTQPDGVTIGFQTKVIAGTDLKEDELSQQVAGKKANEAEELIKAYPGVTAVDVSYSPFWVSSIPKKASKITIV
ncbi:MAG TPA: hypothetical protein VFB59_00885, partial [Candidatus Saccharimonadales bacterium]|nr:hypothetical protein [Candidatus Saccharimonadales bacterium]